LERYSHPVSTPQLLLAAYISASGLTLHLTYSRQMSLTQLCEMGMTPEDMTMVINHIKTQIKIGQKGFVQASLDFRNSVADVEKFEELAVRLRAEATRRRRPTKDVPTQRTDALGTFTVLDAPVPEEPQRVSPEVIAKQFESLSQEFGKGRRLA